MIRRATTLIGVWTLLQGSLLACPVCFTATDSPAANGMSMAILAMLGVTAVVLISFGSFFIYLMRRGRTVARQAIMNQPVRQGGPS
jgi:hypothetical protein